MVFIDAKNAQMDAASVIMILNAQAAFKTIN
jgi:hypothetical protein